MVTTALLGCAFASSSLPANAQSGPPDGAKPASAPQSPFSPAPLSPTVTPDGRARFRLIAPQASSVEVKGNFPSPYEPETITMVKDANGEWSGTSKPLAPEMYAYNVYVDGVPALDLGNAHFKRDAGRLSSTFIVPGNRSNPYAVQQVPHGTVSAIWYSSAKFGKPRRTMIYTPPGYEAGTARYPVLYLLHGGMGDEDSWVGNGRVPQILDNLIAANKILPMIVVMPNVNASQTASADYIEEFEPQGSFFDMAFPDSLVSDLVPFVDRTFRTRPDWLNRAVAGLSMGGAHALWAAFRHPGTFAWVESMSGGYMIIPGLGLVSSMSVNPQIPSIYRFPTAIDPNKVFTVLPELASPSMARMRMFNLVIGERDMLLGQQRTLQAALLNKNIKVKVSEVPGYSHEWVFWRKELVDMLPQLFRPVSN
jgi:enterochelin esterase family protein